MRRRAVQLVLVVVGALVAHASARRLHARLIAACERMFEGMPDTFPPKRMLRGIDEIRANTSRTLALQEQGLASLAASSSEDDVFGREGRTP